MPPQHGKTETLLHAIAWLLRRKPWLRNAYASYAASLAFTKSRLARDYAQSAGVAIRDDANKVNEWVTTDGGGLLATGVGGPLTGNPVDGLLLVDDPHKNRAEAESATVRNRIKEWWTSTAMTRVHPGASVLVVHCVAEGEPVLMASGEWRAIEQVSPGDKVMAYEAGAFVPRAVLAQRASGEDDILLVRTAKKTLRVNARHPFLLESGEWKKAGDLQPGDRVVTIDQGVGSEEPVDEEFMWLFGFLMGDGWVTRWDRHNRSRDGAKTYKTESLCVCVAASVYPTLNDAVVSSLTKFCGRAPRLTRFGYYRIDHNAAGRALLALGLGGGAHGKRIPSWVYELTPALKRAYLRGYADADGCALPRGRDSVRVASVSCDLIEDTRRLAMSAGVRCGRISSFRQRVQAPHSHEPKDYECFTLSINFSSAPDGAETIQSVSPDGRATVYDLTVEGAENFVAGGFVVHNTRWHPDDLIGWLRERNGGQGWEVIELRAIADETDPLDPRKAGEALWPEFMPAEFLAERRIDVGEYDWSSLYDQRPTPKGGAVFEGDVLFSPPPARYRVAIGIDLAYTEKTASDYSVAVVMAESEGRYHILDLHRMQAAAPVFAERLRSLALTYPGAPMVAYVSGVERGVVDLMNVKPDDPGKIQLRIQAKPATADKFVRAQPVAAGWNAGRIFLPTDSPKWAGPLVSEMRMFTGIKDAHDDQVDALAAAYDALSTPRAVVHGLDDGPTADPYRLSADDRRGF